MDEINAAVKIEELSPVKKCLSFEIPWSDVKNELEKAYGLVGKKASVKGFRPGKVPRRILEVHFKEQAEEEAITNIVNRFYTEALVHNNIQPVDRPVVDQKGIELNTDFNFTATVEIQPEFEPKDYIGLEVEKEESVVTEDSVNSRLEQIQNLYASLEEIKEDRPVEEEDFVVIDFSGSVDGEQQKGLSAESYLLQMGSLSFIPGFDKHLLGMAKDENREFTLSFPDDYEASDLAGKEVVFNVTLHAIKVKNVPPLDEAFIENFDKYESLADLKEDVRRNLAAEEEERIEVNLKNRIIDNLLEKNPFEIPSVSLQRQLYILLLEAQRRMVMSGIAPEKAAQMSMQYRDKFKDQAEKMVRTSILLGKIAEAESIKVDDNEVEERLKALSEQYGHEVDQFKDESEYDNYRERLKDEMLEQRVLDFVQEKAKITMINKQSSENVEEGQ